MEYLYAQSGMIIQPASDEDFLTEIDEGFGDIDEELADPEIYSDDVTLVLPSGSESEEEVSALQQNIWSSQQFFEAEC